MNKSCIKIVLKHMTGLELQSSKRDSPMKALAVSFFFSKKFAPMQEGGSLYCWCVQWQYDRLPLF